jgi:hypothetical protein
LVELTLAVGVGQKLGRQRVWEYLQPDWQNEFSPWHDEEERKRDHFQHVNDHVPSLGILIVRDKLVSFLLQLLLDKPAAISSKVF